MDTKSDFNAGERMPQATQKHPDEWQQDMNPDQMAGQNIGLRHDHGSELPLPTAYDVKDVHRTLREDFQDDELKKIPIVPKGGRLQQGATYLDLRDPERRTFTAMGGMSAEEDNRFIPKDEVPYSLWNRLTGVENPERIAERERPRD